MYNLTCVAKQLAKDDRTFVVLNAITGSVPEKPFLSLKQAENLPLNVPIQILWDYKVLDKATIVDILAFQVLENWNFSECKVKVRPFEHTYSPAPEDDDLPF